jgi:DNA-binding MarR family transcriptional regulator
LIVKLLMIYRFTINQMTTLHTAPMAPEDLADHTGYLLRLAHDHAHRVAAAEMPGDAHPREFGVLTSLALAGPLSQQQLAEKLRVNRTLMVRIVDELERRGWVERRRDPADRRSYALHVTPAGREARDRLAPEVARVNVVMAERLTAAERARMNELLRTLITSDPERLVPPDLADISGFLLVQAHYRARDRGNALFRPLGIEIRHYGLLVTLDQTGPTSQQALADRMRFSGTMLTQIIDELERKGLVARARNPADRRSYTVTMTAEGERVLAEARTKVAGMTAELAAPIGEAGDRELRGLLRKLLGI